MRLDRSEGPNLTRSCRCKGDLQFLEMGCWVTLSVIASNLVTLVIDRMARGHPINKLSELLPWNWDRQPAKLAA